MIALVGLGSVGGAVAKIGVAFGMKVIAWSQNYQRARGRVVCATRVSKNELFQEADVLSIHLVLSDRTRGLVGAAELALMKPRARLINTSRGPIVVEADLIAALKEKKIAGAAIDASTRSHCRSTIRSESCRTCWRRRISATSPARCTSASTRTQSRTFADGSTARRRDDHKFCRKSARLTPASGIQFFFSGTGACRSSSLERKSLKISELLALSYPTTRSIVGEVPRSGRWSPTREEIPCISGHEHHGAGRGDQRHRVSEIVDVVRGLDVETGLLKVVYDQRAEKLAPCWTE